VLFGWLRASTQGAVQNLQQLCAILGPIAWGNLYDRLSKNGARDGYNTNDGKMETDYRPVFGFEFAMAVLFLI